MSGKKIDEIESKEYKPRPERIEPQLTQEEIELRQTADQIRTLTETMNKQDMGKQLGISQDRITKICKQFGINLRSGTGHNPNSRKANPLDDQRLVERIKALATVGLSKLETMKQVGIGRDRMGQLVKAHGIRFPGPSQCD